MKKSLIGIVALLVAVTFAFSSIGAVNASSDLPGPTFSVTSGDTSFTTALVPIVSLPGVTTLSNGMLIPVNFKTGEKQFAGDGLLVTGFESGTASACFAFNPDNSIWSAAVAKWDGSKWLLLPTTFSAPKENIYSIACSSVAESGTYALLEWIGDPAKLAAQQGNQSNCNFPVKWVYEANTTYVDNGYGYESYSFATFFVDFSSNAVDYTGMPLTVTVSSTPNGTYTWTPASISGNLVYNGAGSPTDYYYYIPVSPAAVYYNQYGDLPSVTYHLNFGSCTLDVAGNPAT
jgi:hypothetical protein